MGVINIKITNLIINSFFITLEMIIISGKLKPTVAIINTKTVPTAAPLEIRTCAIGIIVVASA